ncbi:MAG: hypothetical protein ACREGJ_03700 [Candidatus Saccharimonadales bacterium]
MIYTVLIPLALLFMPWVLVRYVFATDKTRQLPYMQHAGYLWAAAIAWVLAMTLPNVPISPETDTTTMHFTGGVVATILFLYVTRVYQIKFATWWLQVLALYFFVSGLGVLNELFELFLDKTGISPIEEGDEWWDLLANTVGGFVAYGVFWFTKFR